MMSLYILDINQIASGYRKHEVRKTTAYKQQLNFEDMLSGTEATVSLTSLSSTPDSFRDRTPKSGRILRGREISLCQCRNVCSSLRSSDASMSVAAE